MKSTLVLLLSLSASAGLSSGQQTPGSNRIEMKVERKEGSEWKQVDPALVFGQRDRIRFKFRTNFDGYLYVMNQGTSGDYTLLFPRQDTGEQNRVAAGKEYVVPSTQGSFRITGPAGHDVVFWMISPIELKSGEGSSRSGYVPLPPPPNRAASAASVRPRCDDAIFRARGECIDPAAGPRALPESNTLPENLSRVPRMKSRELIFIREQESAIVSSPVPLKGPVIYEFRLAHN
jgi:hypothetical protein